jgi:glycosyltransferase involved in cell wall biosynthesis
MASHQGVDLELIDAARVSKREARTRLGLPDDERLIVYTGKIYAGYEEVEYLLEAARMLDGVPDIRFVLVGGRYDHVAKFRARLRKEGRRNVVFTGFVRPAEAQLYQLAADALALYYPAAMELNKYRSPGKLFEYMASERPIIAVDLPVLREVLGDGAAVFVPPDSPAEFARAVVDLLDDDAASSALTVRARARVDRFTWDERARSVLEFIEGNAVRSPRVLEGVAR